MFTLSVCRYTQTVKHIQNGNFAQNFSTKSNSEINIIINKNKQGKTLMLTENVSTDLEVPFMTILSLFTVVLLMNGALLPSTSKSESLWLTSKLALNFWSCTQHTSSDFQIPPAANVELSWQHNLSFYYPNPLSFFSKKNPLSLCIPGCPQPTSE